MALADTSQGRAARSPGLKLFILIVLTVATAAPLFLIQMAANDRQNTASDAARDVASGWGAPQTEAGPFLFVPYTITTTENVNGNPVQQTERKVATLLPTNLDIKAAVKTGERWRGIFKVPVYSAQVHLNARFDRDAIAALVPAGAKPDWNSAFVGISVSDPHGVADNVSVKVNGRSFAFQPGLGSGNAAGIHAPIPVGSQGDLHLETAFVLRGSRELSIVPLGQRTTAEIDSPWSSPSFFGTFLPSERMVDARGFKATWTVPYLARGFGQSFAIAGGDVLSPILQSGFGVRFYQPVDHYQLVERSLKYAILFVALTFLIFFVVEIVTDRRLHVVHYSLVGAAQVLFYLLLLSLAEHTGFAVAYAIGAGATVTMIGLYSLSVLASAWRSATLTVVLAALYAALYVILNAEDYALLIGSTVLFAALATTMYLTRHVDWYRAAPTTA